MSAAEDLIRQKNPGTWLSELLNRVPADDPVMDARHEAIMLTAKNREPSYFRDRRDAAPAENGQPLPSVVRPYADSLEEIEAQTEKTNGHTPNGTKPNGFRLDIGAFEAAVTGNTPAAAPKVEEALRQLAILPVIPDPVGAVLAAADRTPVVAQETGAQAPVREPTLTLDEIKEALSNPPVQQPGLSLEDIQAELAKPDSAAPAEKPEWQKAAEQSDAPSLPAYNGDDGDDNDGQSSINGWLAGGAVLVVLLITALVIGFSIRKAAPAGPANVAGFLRQMGPVPASIIPMHAGIPAAIAAARGPAAQLSIGGVPVKHATDVKVAAAPVPRPHRVETSVSTPRSRPARPAAASVVAAEPARPASAGQAIGSGSMQDQLMSKFGCLQKPYGSMDRNSCMDRVVKILDNAHQALKQGLSLPTIFTQPQAPARPVALAAPVSRAGLPVCNGTQVHCVHPR